MITIPNLRPHEIQLLNDIWKCDSLDELEEYISTLALADRILARQLVQLLLIEGIDQDQAESNDLSLASNILAQYRR